VAPDMMSLRRRGIGEYSTGETGIALSLCDQVGILSL
jgi:hypothetical protein